MDIKELKDRLSEQEHRLRKARNSGMGVREESERMKTLMLNRMGEIMTAIEMAESAARTIERLNAEVDSADEELKQMDREIKRLKGEEVSEEEGEKLVSIGEILKEEAGAVTDGKSGVKKKESAKQKGKAE